MACRTERGRRGGIRPWLARLLAGALLAAACLHSGCGPRRRPEPPRGAAFKVMTWNVNWGAPGAELVPRAILDSGADVVCLQETNRAWEEFLVPRLREAFPRHLFRHGRGAGGMAVFSRWPVREVAWAPTGAGWFPGWLLEVQTPLGPVQILAVHLRPAVSETGSVGPGPYYSTKPIRRAEIEELHALLKDGAPTLVLGDFNEGSGGRAVAYLEKRSFTNALGEFDAGSSTWRWRVAGCVTVRQRLDHVLYAGGLYCCRSEVFRRGASDHYPVLAVFDGRALRPEPVPASAPPAPAE